MRVLTPVVLTAVLLVAGCSSDVSPATPTSPAATTSTTTPAPTSRTARQLALGAGELTAFPSARAGTGAATVRSAAALVTCLGGSTEGADAAGSDDRDTGASKPVTSASSAAFVLGSDAEAAAVLRAAVQPRATACFETYVAELLTRPGARVARPAVTPQSAVRGAAFRATVGGRGVEPLVSDIRLLTGGRGVVVLQVTSRGAAAPTRTHATQLGRLVAAVDERLTT